MNKSHEEKSHEKSLTLLQKYLPDSLVRYAIAPYLAERVWEIWSEEERTNYPSDEIIIHTKDNTIYEMEYPSMRILRTIEREYNIEYIFNGRDRHNYIIGEGLFNEFGDLTDYRLRLWNRLTDVSSFLEIDEDDRTDIFDYVLCNEKYIIAMSDITLVYLFEYSTGRKLWKKEYLYGIEAIPVFTSNTSDFIVSVDENDCLVTWDALTGEEKVIDNVHHVKNIYKNSKYLLCLCDDYDGPESLTIRRIDSLEHIVKEIDLKDFDCNKHTNLAVLSHDNKFIRIIRYSGHSHYMEIWDIEKGLMLNKHKIESNFRSIISVELSQSGYFVFEHCPHIYVYDMYNDTLKIIHTGPFIGVYAGPWNSVYVIDKNKENYVYKQKLVVPTTLTL